MSITITACATAEFFTLRAYGHATWKNPAVAHAVMVIDMQRAFIDGHGLFPLHDARSKAGAPVSTSRTTVAHVAPRPKSWLGTHLRTQPGDVVVRKRGGQTGSPEPTWTRCFVIKTITSAM